MTRSAVILCALGLHAVGSSAFVFVAPTAGLASRNTARSSALSMSQEKPGLSRRIFLTDVAVAFTAGVAGISLGANAVAADGGAGQLQDLDGGAPTAMGSVKVTDGEPLSEEAARIQRKLAAQAKVNGKATSGQMTYSESRAAEEEKQSKMKAERNDKAKRRAAMCEQLGRGC